MRFTDGAAYERLMGRWSQLAGAVFLDWLAPRAGLAWLDIGCGNGAFTELIQDRCAPLSLDGVDPSPEQLAFARSRPGADAIRYHDAGAMALPFADGTFDAAVMALVIFFVPEPRQGLAEMVRVLKPTGRAAAYAWDVTRGGFPFNAVHEEMRAAGLAPAGPPSATASRMESLKELWAGAGLVDIETREIVVERTFADFDEFWRITLTTNAGSMIASLAPAEHEALRRRVEARLPASASGRVTFSSRANAIKGRKPG